MKMTLRLYIDEARTALNIFPLRLQYNLSRPSYILQDIVKHCFILLDFVEFGKVQLNCSRLLKRGHYGTK